MMREDEIQIEVTVNLTVSLNGENVEEVLEILQPKVATHLLNLQLDGDAEIDSVNSSIKQIVELTAEERERLQEMYVEQAIQRADMDEVLEMAADKLDNDLNGVSDMDLLCVIREYEPQVLEEFKKEKLQNA